MIERKVDFLEWGIDEKGSLGLNEQVLRRLNVATALSQGISGWKSRLRKTDPVGLTPLQSYLLAYAYIVTNAIERASQEADSDRDLIDVLASLSECKASRDIIGVELLHFMMDVDDRGGFLPTRPGLLTLEYWQPFLDRVISEVAYARDFSNTRTIMAEPLGDGRGMLWLMTRPGTSGREAVLTVEGSAAGEVRRERVLVRCLERDGSLLASPDPDNASGIIGRYLIDDRRDILDGKSEWLMARQLPPPSTVHEWFFAPEPSNKTSDLDSL